MFSPCCGSLFVATANDERSSVVRRIVLALFFIANKSGGETLNPGSSVLFIFDKLLPIDARTYVLVYMIVYVPAADHIAPANFGGR